MITSLAFLLLSIAIDWFFNARVTQGKRVSEIKKLREELTMVSTKTSGLENQVERAHLKRGVMALKRRHSR